MSKFETVLLISPEITEILKKNQIKEFISSIESNAGKIINSEEWGLRDLSYKIGSYSKAFYNFFQIEIDGKKLDQIKKNLIQNENFIRHLFIKVTDHQELPTKLSNEKK